MNKDLYVVGIGASAGGLNAIHSLFDKLPKDSGMAFVIIQHLSPDFKSLMPELLAKHTEMAIHTAEDGLELLPNTVYLNRSDSNLVIDDGKLKSVNKAKGIQLNLPVDIFFHSLGKNYGEKACGIILSGTGTDGSRGIVTVKEAGGTTFVQDPASAQFDGMPNTSITTNQIDFILDPASIAQKLVETINNKVSLQRLWSRGTSEEGSFLDILSLVLRKHHIDFRGYKRNTLFRRIEKRVSFLNIATISDYYEYLKNNDDEVMRLKQDFLIGVTSFFRDEEAFDSLASAVLPRLAVKNRELPLRIWVAGCSTGEEAYSMAMLLDSYLKAANIHLDFKVFATDADPEAIKIASAGSYHINAVQEIPKVMLEQYFTSDGNNIQINKALREKIIFSQHNILTDPPFLRTDLVSCRNMLIYLDNSTQLSALKAFQYSLNQNGFLFLGSSESLGDFAKHFKSLDAHWKIFENTSATKIPTNSSVVIDQNGTTYIPATPLIHRSAKRPVVDVEQPYKNFLSNHFAPSCIFIDNRYNILYTKGDVVEKIRVASGVFQSNLLKMLPSHLSSVIRNGLRTLEKTQKEVLLKGVRVNPDEDNPVFDISIIKPKSLFQDCFLLVFHEERVASSDELVIERKDVPEENQLHISELEAELYATREKLHNAIEELETSNEELQSSNEELMASNEELQSTNEELQSVNEELYTVNAELQIKNKELIDVTDETDNLLTSTDIGTLFLDSKLQIRKFTPSISTHFDLKGHDKGRPIQSFSATFKEESHKKLIEDCKSCLKMPGTYEDEIVGADGQIYFRQIRPFVSSTKSLEGIVITFVNISDLRRAEAKLVSSELRFESLFDSLTEGMFFGAFSEKIPGRFELEAINTKLRTILGLGDDKLSLDSLSKLPCPKQFDAWEEILNEIGSGRLDQFEDELDYQGRVYLLKLFSPSLNEVVGILSDISILAEASREKATYTKKLEESLKVEKDLSEIKSRLVATASHQFRTPLSVIKSNLNLIELFQSLDDESFRKKAMMSIERIELASDTLDEIIEDMLTLNLANSSESLDLTNEVDVVALVENALQMNASVTGDERNIALSLEGAPRALKTDSKALFHCIMNLVSNALKYSPSDKAPLVRVLFQKTQLKIEVEDFGIGIPADEIKNIGSPFYRASNAQEVSGNGLGLSIVQEFINKLGGELKIQSTVGEGSIFTIVLKG